MHSRIALILVFTILSVTLLAQVNVAIAQIFCLDGDREGNFKRIENALIEASGQNAHIVCFPEMAILGWVNPEAHELAHPIPGKDFSRLSALAKKYQIYMCVGLAEKVGQKLYDSVVLIDDEGKLRLKHRKINILTELMEPPYTPGEWVDVVDTKFGRIGLLICADSFDEHILSQMREKKPQLVLIPYGWAKEQEDWPAHGLELRKTVKRAAMTISCPVVGTDLIGEISHGPWKGLVYGGQSVAFDAKGQMLALCKDRDKEVRIVAINTGSKISDH